MLSIQTNVASLIAQQNLLVNTNFQSQTIERLTSGYRINSSSDDPAGLAVANSYRSSIAEVTQGVLNANDGISNLQIIDGGISNISQMLDRLRTLATQSASDTFTGDRTTVNSEFQSLLGEIDRQAQSIGLDTNGQFAKALSVYVGGGKTSATGAFSTDNGTVTVDLTGSAVDSRALGLAGMQAVGGTADIGDSSSTHTVEQIVNDANNTTQVGGQSDLYFAGPGFSDGGQVKASINLSGVTDMNTLVDAVNAAIQNAGNGDSQAATAFKNAGVTAVAVTDANGTHLGFTSATTAFQVQAGDVMANAFLGNFATGANGAAIASTVTGGNTAAAASAFSPANVTLQIVGGGLTAPKNITFSSNDQTAGAAIADLVNQVNSDAGLQAAGIGVTNAGAGSPLVFSSYTGEKFSVQVTGDSHDALGFGAFATNTSTLDAPDYTSISGAAAYNAAAASGTANLEFSVNGAGTAGNTVAVNLSGGSATASAVTATTAADVEGKSMTIAVAGGSLDSGAVTVAFGADTAAALTGSWTNVAGQSLTINNGGGAQTVTFAAPTGASATAASTSTWANAAGQSLTYNTGAGGSNGAQTVTFTAAGATAATATAASTSTWANAAGQTLTYDTGTGGGSGTVSFTAAAATAANATAASTSTWANAAGQSLAWTTGGSNASSGTVNFTATPATAANATAASTSTWANAAGQALTWTTGGSNASSGTVNFTTAAATGANATTASENWAAANGETLTYQINTGTVNTINLNAAAATGATATVTGGFSGVTNGQTLDWSTGTGGSSGTVNFNVAAATGASATATWGSGPGTDTLSYNTGAGGEAGTVTFSTPADVYEAANQINTQAGTDLNAQVVGGNLVITSKNVGANTLTFSGSGATDLGIASSYTNGTAAQQLTAAQVAGQITAQAGAYLNAQVNGSGNLVITSKNVGANTMTLTGGTASLTGLGSVTAGAAAGTLTAAQVAGQITTQSNGDLTATVSGGHVVIASNTTGSANTLTLGGTSLANLGLSSGAISNGTNAGTLTANGVAAQITAQAGTYLNAAVNAGGALVITDKATGAAQTLTLSGASALSGVTTVTAGADAGTLTANGVAAQITAQAGTYLNAAVNAGGALVITDKATGAAQTLTLSGASALSGVTTVTAGADGGALTANGVAAQITAQAGAYLSATVNGSGALVITSKNAGANTMTLSGAAALSGVTTVTPGAAGSALDAYGVAAQITAQAGAYLNATVNASGALVITSKATGSANTMTLSGAAALTGIGTVTAGTNGDNTAALVRAAIAAQTSGLTVSGSGSNIIVTDSTPIAGTAHTLTIGGAAATGLGFTGGNATNTGVAGADTAAQQAAIINGTSGIEVNASVNAAGLLVLTALDKGAHAITIDDGTGNAANALGFTTTAGTAVTTTNGTGASVQSVVQQLNNLFAQDTALQQAGLQASQSGGVIAIASSNNTFFRMGTSTSGTNANLGFGVAASTTQYGGATAAGANMSSVDAGGISSTQAISFAALANGGDEQAITISANDPSGAIQSKTITLQNDAMAVRDGRSIDEAVGYINTQLQQSNNPTLQKIVAVKENNGGAEAIDFISSLGSFTVGVGSSVNGNGLNGGAAATETGALTGTGSTISVDTEANALQAVAALSTAVATLGSAQAAVGAGENQLNYAVGLAQSQISNFSAAESRIRDADVAAEAANLTKAQVLQQASIAAMAQANSAPQAVLALLRT
jgi:flagellin